MAQADLNVANQSGSAFRADLNNQLLALGTLMSGASEPGTTYAYMLWADTANTLLKQRNAANNGWITIGTLGSANLGLLPSGGTLTAALGSAATPGVTFTGDTDTGLYSPGANQVALGTNGQQRLAIDSTGRVLVGPGTARAVGGAVVATLAVETLGQAASFVRNSADTSGGILAIGKSRGTAAGDVTAVQNGDILGELRFVGANGTDMTSIGAHIRATVDGEVGTAGDTTDMPTSLIFSTTPDGAATALQRMVIDSQGRVGLGTSSVRGTSLLDARGDISFGSNASYYGLLSYNAATGHIESTSSDGGFRWIRASGPATSMTLDSSGELLVQQVYTQTTANAANVHVFSDGTLRRSTSSEKYKTDVETLEDVYADALLQCRPVWYRSTCNKDNPSHGWWGFIAEEVAEIDPRLVHWKTVEVTYDDKGSPVETPCKPEPEGVAYDRFVPHLLNLIKRQGEAIAELQAEVAALKAA